MGLLNQTAEYALRAMAYLALDPREGGPDGRRISSADLSEATGIPRPYVPKVLRELVSVGLLDAHKGHRGGYRLAKPAEDITFLAILEALGVDVQATNCAFGWRECGDVHPCPLHEAFSSLHASFRRWAAGTTLADVRDGAADLGRTGISALVRD